MFQSFFLIYKKDLLFNFIKKIIENKGFIGKVLQFY